MKSNLILLIFITITMICLPFITQSILCSYLESESCNILAILGCIAVLFGPLANFLSNLRQISSNRKSREINKKNNKNQTDKKKSKEQSRVEKQKKIRKNNRKKPVDGNDEECEDDMDLKMYEKRRISFRHFRRFKTSMKTLINEIKKDKIKQKKIVAAKEISEKKAMDMKNIKKMKDDAKIKERNDAKNKRKQEDDKNEKEKMSNVMENFQFESLINEIEQSEKNTAKRCKKKQEVLSLKRRQNRNLFSEDNDFILQREKRSVYGLENMIFPDEYSNYYNRYVYKISYANDFVYNNNISSLTTNINNILHLN